MLVFLRFVFYHRGIPSNDTNSNASASFKLALKHVNANSSLLPNTSLKSFEDQLVIDQNNLHEIGKHYLQFNYDVLSLYYNAVTFDVVCAFSLATHS